MEVKLPEFHKKEYIIHYLTMKKVLDSLKVDFK